MSIARTFFLVVLMLLLAIVLVAGQLMVLAQQSVLKTSFLLPHVERLFSTISTPQTHEEIVRYMVAEIVRSSRVRGVTAELREQLMKASIKAFSAQWIQEELLDIVNKALAVLRGRSQEFKHTIYLSRRKDVLISELTRALPPEAQSEMRAGSSVVPDALELTSLVGKEVPAALKMLGQRYILFSLLFIYVVPGVLLLLGLQVGRVRWGIVGIGAAAFISGVTALVGFSSVFPGTLDTLLRSGLTGLPTAFAWLPTFARGLGSSVLALGRSIAIAFAASGAAVLALGVVVVRLTRKKAE